MMSEVGSNSTSDEGQFQEKVEVEGTPVMFQLDSGAKANILSH